MILVAPEAISSLRIADPTLAHVQPGGSDVIGLVPVDVVRCVHPTLSDHDVVTIAPLYSLTWARAKLLTEYLFFDSPDNEKQTWCWAIQPIEDRNEFSALYLEPATTAVAVLSVGKKQLRQDLESLQLSAGAWICNSIEIEDLRDHVRVTLVPFYPGFFFSGIRKQTRLALPKMLALPRL